MQSFQDLNCFALIVGNARSGSTMLGSLLDAHPNVCIANESSASSIFWRNLSREEILREIEAYSESHRATGRDGGGYTYAIPQRSLSKPRIQVMGDKIWNPATLLLHGDHALIPRLESTLEVPVKIIHTVRNPFDTIATMHKRSGAPIRDRILWYFMHCDAAVAIYDRSRSDQYMNVHLEDVITSPEAMVKVICQFLGLDENDYPLDACREMLFKESKKTRFQHTWDRNDIQSIEERMSRYPFLEKYTGDDNSELDLTR